MTPQNNRNEQRDAAMEAIVGFFAAREVVKKIARLSRSSDGKDTLNEKLELSEKFHMKARSLRVRAIPLLAMKGRTTGSTAADIKAGEQFIALVEKGLGEKALVEAISSIEHLNLAAKLFHLNNAPIAAKLCEKAYTPPVKNQTIEQVKGHVSKSVKTVLEHEGVKNALTTGNAKAREGVNAVMENEDVQNAIAKGNAMAREGVDAVMQNETVQEVMKNENVSKLIKGAGSFFKPRPKP